VLHEVVLATSVRLNRRRASETSTREPCHPTESDLRYIVVSAILHIEAVLNASERVTKEY
jgi:hypothetical protein